MLTTVLNPSHGSAKITGFDIKKQRNQVRKNIGVVFQDPALDTELTAKENLDYHARMYGLNKKEREHRIQDVLKIVELTEKQNVLVKKFSGGMKRKLEIARGLMHSPKILFLDEPTLGLDSQTRRTIWQYIRKMNITDKTTIFLTTHYMEEADKLCDRVAIINHGKIIVTDKPEDLKVQIGNDVITLSTTNINDLILQLKKQDWIQNLKKHDGFLTIGVKKGEEKIPLVIDIAQKNNIKIKAISVRKPTLDDVFLYYTGHSIENNQEKNETNAG